MKINYRYHLRRISWLCLFLSIIINLILIDYLIDYDTRVNSLKDIGDIIFKTAKDFNFGQKEIFLILGIN